MKKIPILIVATLMLVAFISCETESNSEKGEKAAVEFCNCLEINTADECEDELRENYTNAEYTNSDFVAAFNSVAAPSCDVTLEIITY